MDKNEKINIKKFVLENNLHILQRKVSKSLFFDENNNIARYKKNFEINKHFIENDFKTWHIAENINNAYYHRVRRARERIKKIIENKSLFLTLTFTDDVLNNISKESRRKYVQRFLKSFNALYVANIDFGGKNGREHYHAVISIDKINYKLWKYGSINGKKILSSEKSSKKLAKYISKLTNHCFKETTKQSYLIYSR